jgi:hypothetical protein
VKLWNGSEKQAGNERFISDSQSRVAQLEDDMITHAVMDGGAKWNRMGRPNEAAQAIYVPFRNVRGVTRCGDSMAGPYLYGVKDPRRQLAYMPGASLNLGVASHASVDGICRVDAVAVEQSECEKWGLRERGLAERRGLH